MNILTIREKALEAKFHHEKLIEYKILARRNHLLGLWAAHYLHYAHEQAEAYARLFVGGVYATFEGHAIVMQIKQDFSQHTVDMSEHRIRRQLYYCHQDASEQILKE